MEISIKQMTDNDYEICCKQLNFDDADAEFIEAFKDKDDLYSVWNGNIPAGVAQVSKGKKAFLNLFINLPYRCQGIGNATVKICEQILQDAGAETITTSYRLDNNAHKLFAEKRGYIRSFSSTYMEYKGGRFDMPALPIREYKDDDYESAHEMYAIAFHEMRTRVGDFPDSVVAQPNDSMRNQWDLTKKERLVYVRNDEIIGYSHIVENEIGSISVKSRNQGQGIGRMFAKFIINKILENGYKTISLYCVVGNEAKRLYNSLGFTDVYTVEYATKQVIPSCYASS